MNSSSNASAPATPSLSEQKTHKAICLKHVPGKLGQVYYPLQTISVPTPSPPPASLKPPLLFRPTHIALNHRDLFLRQALYPSPSSTTPLFSDCICIPYVPSTPSSPPSSTSTNPTSINTPQKRYLFNPTRGWRSSPSGPESPSTFGILGGTSTLALGAGSQILAIPQGSDDNDDDADQEVIECPPHLSDAEGAALSLCGVTAWRALVTKAAVKRGDKILVTGIGGGVALMVASLAGKMGVEVWVTSGDAAKIERARKEVDGVRGGVSYREEKWERKLRGMVGGDLDAIIDGAGGDIGKRATTLLRHGGVIVSYGMTTGPVLSLPMAAVLKNIEVKGSTMGSRREWREMVEFVGREKVRPVVEVVKRGSWDDLSGLEELFEMMKKGSQFGKLVWEIIDEREDKRQVAKGSKL
ncbi:hypothetical protein MMC25_005793 [Agyrium rufum]|nr:hypothetical protein [Agyrium rufum]